MLDHGGAESIRHPSHTWVAFGVLKRVLVLDPVPAEWDCPTHAAQPYTTAARGRWMVTGRDGCSRVLPLPSLPLCWVRQIDGAMPVEWMRN